jgi:hypothetical protein
MQWAPDSPDLWAPDSGRPNRWAPDTFEHLTLGRGVDLFLGAKAAEGASPKTITWYRMILMRAVAAFGRSPCRSPDGPTCGPGSSSSGQPSPRLAWPATSER